MSSPLFLVPRLLFFRPVRIIFPSIVESLAFKFAWVLFFIEQVGVEEDTNSGKEGQEEKDEEALRGYAHRAGVHERNRGLTGTLPVRHNLLCVQVLGDIFDLSRHQFLVLSERNFDFLWCFSLLGLLGLGSFYLRLVIFVQGFLFFGVWVLGDIHFLLFLRGLRGFLGFFCFRLSLVPERIPIDVN